MEAQLCAAAGPPVTCGQTGVRKSLAQRTRAGSTQEEPNPTAPCGPARSAAPHPNPSTPCPYLAGTTCREAAVGEHGGCLCSEGRCQGDSGQDWPATGELRTSAGGRVRGPLTAAHLGAGALSIRKAKERCPRCLLQQLRRELPPDPLGLPGTALTTLLLMEIVPTRYPRPGPRAKPMSEQRSAHRTAPCTQQALPVPLPTAAGRTPPPATPALLVHGQTRLRGNRCQCQF